MRRSDALALAVSLWAGGCGGAPICPGEDGVLVEGGPSCLVARDAIRWAEALAARPLTEGQARAVMDAMVAMRASDPAGLDRRLSAAGQAFDTLAEGRGLLQGEARSAAIWALKHGEGPFGDVPEVQSAVMAAVAPWASDDEEKLVLSEMDVEGWIRLASLCREAQGGTSLRVSMADRVALYRSATQRFEAGSRADQVALVGIGAAWADLRDRWRSSAYDRQQQWIRTAPLPPPMTGTSPEYFEAVMRGDLVGLASSVHDVLGPLRMDIKARPAR